MSGVTDGFEFQLGKLIAELQNANKSLDEVKGTDKERDGRISKLEARISKLEKAIIAMFLLFGGGTATLKYWDVIKVFLGL